MRHGLKALALAALLGGTMTVDAETINGYFEGTVYRSNLYPVGTTARLDFTYDTDTAPMPYCYADAGTDYCDYNSPSPAGWLTTRLTVGSDTYNFPDSATHKEVYLENWSISDVFSLVESAYTPDGKGFMAIGGRVSDFSESIDFLEGLALPTSIDLAIPEGRGSGFWLNDFYSEADRSADAYFYWDRLHLASVSIDPGALLKQLYDAATGVGPGNSLADKIALAQVYYEATDIQATCAILDDFVSQVGVLLTVNKSRGATEQLVADAEEIRIAISCAAE